MKILLSGASGTLGTALRGHLTTQGHTVTSLVRQPAQNSSQLQWDPYAEKPIHHPDQLGEMDAVIHLSGEGIADARWTNARKIKLRNSRILPLFALEKIFTTLQKRPATLITASGINCFGNQGDTILTDSSPYGTDFLSTLCADWESSALAIAPLGVRVVPLRFGAILTPAGGILKKLLPMFRLGLGGPLGNGRQYLSWIAISDVCRMIEFVLSTPSIAGPTNATSPEPVTNTAFTWSLANAVHRPAIFPAPAIALRLAFGQLANDMLLSSTRAIPERLAEAGFQFSYANLDAALSSMLANK